MLGFATLGFLALYAAFRYNLLYVYNPTTDTHGQAYSMALQQLTVGVYLSELCLIGLFATATRRDNKTAGPLFLMIIFTSLTVAYHAIMRKTIGPLTRTLPNSILHQYEQEWQALHEQEEGNRTSDARSGVPASSSTESSKPVPSGLLGMFLKFFKPQKYASYELNLDELMKTYLGDTAPALPTEMEKCAYSHPAITSQMPKLWLAEDTKGISKREIQNTPKDLPITDDGAEIDEKGKLHWDKERLDHLPAWKDRSYF
jgi:calcium permeable stress-gated cation channel